MPSQGQSKPNMKGVSVENQPIPPTTPGGGWFAWWWIWLMILGVDTADGGDAGRELLWLSPLSLRPRCE